MTNLNMKTIALDSETKKLMNTFKSIVDKEDIANILANETVTKGLEENSTIIKHFYAEDEPTYITASCISFGLINYMPEDFYTVKEVLGYNYVLELLQNAKSFISLIK